MKLGLVGLGQMGKPMAMNMHKPGGELMVYDVHQAAYLEFAAKGIATAASLAALSDCEIVFLSLPDTQIVEKVLLAPSGLVALLKPGAIVCDLSTIDYMASTRIAQSCENKGIEFMDAPVTGMEARAIDGTLTVICGGKPEVYERLLPYLNRIGNNILHMGKHGCGQLTKAINNILFDINIAAVAEILPMAVKLGLDPEKIGAVINSGSGRSYASEFFIPRMLRNHFTDGYPLQHAYKDLVCGADLSAQLSVPLPLMHAATTTYQMALLKGFGHEDKGAMVKVFAELLGVQLDKKE
jgi:3-hydroxyisobutyrate dehydrogenase-like beta-hydroxyacid dehydrogenase